MKAKKKRKPIVQELDAIGLAYATLAIGALEERVCALEAENARLRAMWGGTNSHGEPYWLAFKAPVVVQGSITTGLGTNTA